MWPRSAGYPMATTQRYADKIKETQNQEYIALNLTSVVIFLNFARFSSSQIIITYRPNDKNMLDVDKCTFVFSGNISSVFRTVKGMCCRKFGVRDCIHTC